MKKILKEYIESFRPLKQWFPELLNRLYFPDFIMRKARRNERAEFIRSARKNGIHLNRRWYKEIVDKTIKIAPKKK